MLESKSTSIAEIVEATKADVTLQLLAKKIVDKSKHVNEALKSFEKILPKLSVSSDGLITRGQRIMLPASLHEKVLDSAHAGHLGINSMKRHLHQNGTASAKLMTNSLFYSFI